MTTPNQPLRPMGSVPLSGPQLPQPSGVPVARQVVPIDWFRRMPNGGTVYRKSA
jgi:hypothetical protein